MPDVLIFGGTDATIAVGNAVLDAGLGIAGIVTVGPSFEISYSANPVNNSRFVDISNWCVERKIPMVQFTNYDDVLAQFNLSTIPVCLVAGWYHMVPRDVRERFELGCIGFHASLLPQLRGGAPLNWAILADFKETGVTMFEFGDDVDDGPVYGQERFSIRPRAYIDELVEDAAKATATLVGKLLSGILNGEVKPVAQSGRPSYGLQRQPEDGLIDWHLPAEAIDRTVRAVSRPYPGAFTKLDGQKILIWCVEPARNALQVYGAPGQMTRLPGTDLPHVVTGDGILAILEATDDAGKSMVDFLRQSNQKRFSV